MGRPRCPNCGGGLGMLREEHQSAGAQRIWLRWSICSECHHVALDAWGFIDQGAAVDGAAGPIPGREESRKGTPRT